MFPIRHIPEDGENASAEPPKRVDPISNPNMNVNTMSACIAALEAESKLERARSSSILTILLTVGFNENNITKQMPLLLALTHGTNLSDLNVNASASITWESDVFEQLIMYGYDLRKCRSVENGINDIIDMNWLYAWYNKYPIMFARIITLASIDWSSTPERNINWKQILAGFTVRNGRGPRDSDNIAPEEVARWKACAAKLRAAIQAQIDQCPK